MRRRLVPLVLWALALAAAFVVPAGSPPRASAATVDELAAAAPEPRLWIQSVDPAVPVGQGELTIFWDTGTGQLAGLERSIDGGEPERIGQFDPIINVKAPGSTAQARQVFELTQAGVDEKLLVRAVVQNGQVQTLLTARPIPPRDTPAWIDRLIQYAPYAIYALLAVLTALYLRSLRAARRTRGDDRDQAAAGIPAGAPSRPAAASPSAEVVDA